jgi:hypothetical protein
MIRTRPPAAAKASMVLMATPAPYPYAAMFPGLLLR